MIIKSFTAGKGYWDGLVRIGLDPHNFVGLGSASRACRSRSGRIGSISVLCRIRILIFYPIRIPDPGVKKAHLFPGSNLKFFQFQSISSYDKRELFAPYWIRFNPDPQHWRYVWYHGKSTFPVPNLVPFCVSGRMVMEPPSPQCVGREFVRQYYTLLNQAPLHLHR